MTQVPQSPPPIADIALTLHGRPVGPGKFALYAKDATGHEYALEVNGGEVVANSLHPPDPGAGHPPDPGTIIPPDPG